MGTGRCSGHGGSWDAHSHRARAGVERCGSTSSASDVHTCRELREHSPTSWGQKQTRQANNATAASPPPTATHLHLRVLLDHAVDLTKLTLPDLALHLPAPFAALRLHNFARPQHRHPCRAPIVLKTWRMPSGHLKAQIFKTGAGQAGRAPKSSASGPLLVFPGFLHPGTSQVALSLYNPSDYLRSDDCERAKGSGQTNLSGRSSRPRLCQLHPYSVNYNATSGQLADM